MTEDKAIREKLVLHGAGALSDAELLSILADERPPRSQLATASQALESANSRLSELAGMDIRKLRSKAGFGVKSSANIAAAIELGRRIQAEESGTKTVILSNEDVAEIFTPRMAGLKYEEFWVLYLTTANTLIEKHMASRGGVAGTAVDHKIIVKKAIELLASRIILVHNHPSGIAQPSADDRFITGRICEAARLFDIEVIDHLIITSDGYYSFRKYGLIG